MRKAVAMMSAVALAAVFAVSVAAQAPNFSGKWTLDAEKTAAAAPPAAAAGGGGGGGRGGGGQAGPMTIKQDATTLTIEREGQNGVTSTVYKLDGAEGKITMGQVEATYKATVKGATIEIATARPGRDGGAPTTTTVVYAKEGDWLVTSTTAPGRGGGEPTTTKRYYKAG